MILTILDHNYLHLSELPSKLKDLLSYKEEKYDKRRNKWSRTYKSLIDFTNNTTYAGLAPYICEHIRVDTIEDQRTFPEIEFQVPNLTEKLRDYQVEYLLSSIKEKRMVNHCTMASGKTIMIAALLDCLQLKTMVLAPDLTVMGQLQTELPRYLPHGDFDNKYIIGIRHHFLKYPVEELREFQVVIMDECHNAPAQQNHDIIMSTNAPFRFGFTGTPTGRSDNRDLVTQGLFGKIVQLIDRQELVEQGYVAPVNLEFHRGTWEGNYHIMEDLLIVNNPLRNKLIKKIVDNHPHDTIIILVTRQEHGKILQDMIKKSIFVYGDTEKDDREKIRQGMKEGKYRVLIASKVFSSGLDIENLTLGINATGLEAKILTEQGAGRVARPWHSLCKLWIHIYDDYHPTLEEHAQECMKTYKQQGIPVTFVGFPPGKERKLREMYDNVS